ncbi:MAG: hypothetical protein FWC62_05775 [Firmicutes bacterium]|nr:hypothetical protein [Bacillota bacterium]
MAKELNAEQREMRSGVGHTGGAIAAVVAVSVIFGLCVLLVIYAGLLALLPDYFLIHSFSLSKLGLFTAFTRATRFVPPILLGILVLILVALLIMLCVFLARKILAPRAKPAAAPPVEGYSSPVWGDSAPVSEAAGDLPYDDEYIVFEETPRVSPPQAPPPPARAPKAQSPRAQPAKAQLTAAAPVREIPDSVKVDQYLKQLEAMSPEEIEDFFAH